MYFLRLEAQQALSHMLGAQLVEKLLLEPSARQIFFLALPTVVQWNEEQDQHPSG